MMFQTRTRVHTQAAQQQERQAGYCAALRAMAAVQLGAQLLLWITFFGYDRVQQTVWQSALMTGPVMAALYLLWKNAAPNRWAALALLPCLQLDACLALLALSGLIAQAIPQYPAWVGAVVPCAACVLTVLRAGTRGVGYGAKLFQWLLLGLFVLSTVFLRASDRADRLWPILGSGLGPTALAALAGVGSVWGTALLFALPQEGQPPQKALRWALIPWVLGCVWALWFGFVRPWAAGDALAVAEKMMGLARHAMSVMLYELAGVLWLLLLPLALCGCAVSTELLMRRAWPRLPRPFPAVVALLPSCLMLLCDAGQALRVLETLLPYRAPVALACGAALCVLRGKGKK